MSKTQEYGHLLQSLSANIKSLRAKKGWTQEQMTDFGFDYRHYQKLESGRYSPSLQTLFRLAQVFKVKIKDLF
ncbi:MAG: helix-turn-helix transcriptional regulator [Proteobacteria bacterium]|nr:helix-turn-helix transcriptional regulator [Pseudomonadota bacterium]